MVFTVKQARVLSERTQAEMAKHLGICRHSYIKIEKEPENATFEQGRKISEITGIPIEQIFFGR
ncbi:MAG: helix-turn-helix transcriptional regulator [Eubacteriales bacterium]